MATKAVIYPGTFDPITFGHIDLVQRASELFERVIVAVATNPMKKPLITADERLRLAQSVCAPFPQVEVVAFDGLLIDFAKAQGVTTVLRGLRALTDYEYEFQLASMNRRLMSHFETVFLATGEQYAYISSSLVREIAHYGGDVSAFVPGIVQQALAKVKSSVAGR